MRRPQRETVRRYVQPPQEPLMFATRLTWWAWLFPPSYRTWPWWASENWDYRVAQVRMLPILRSNGLIVTWRDYVRAYVAVAGEVLWAVVVCLGLVFLGCALVWL